MVPLVYSQAAPPDVACTVMMKLLVWLPSPHRWSHLEYAVQFPTQLTGVDPACNSHRTCLDAVKDVSPVGPSAGENLLLDIIAEAPHVGYSRKAQESIAGVSCTACCTVASYCSSYELGA